MGPSHLEFERKQVWVLSLVARCDSDDEGHQDDERNEGDDGDEGSSDEGDEGDEGHEGDEGDRGYEDDGAT